MFPKPKQGISERLTGAGDAGGVEGARQASKARGRQGAPAPSITGGCRKYQKPLILKQLETAT